MKHTLATLTLLLLTLPGQRAVAADTFCNPINIDYVLHGYSRTGADPVIVYFKDKYWLFSTWDKPGMRVSDDLVHWSYVPFPAESLPLMTSENGTYCAAAVATRGEWMYFLNMLPRKELKGRQQIMRTRDPAHGPWEKVGEVRNGGDPDLFFDDDGRLYMYYGLGNPGSVFEIDTKTFTEIPNSDCKLMPEIPEPAGLDNGFELGQKELTGLVDQTATGPLKGHFTRKPCREGSWMTKYKGLYYYQQATPGTACDWYCDNVMVGNSPTGPFTQADYAPASMKVGGYVNSAGHSGVFQDKYGNWWRVTTMWVGIPGMFVRRLGLFPAGFDKQGRMFTQTTLGDYPQILPDGLRSVDWAVTTKSARPANVMGWQLLSYNKPVQASSSQPGHEPSLAVDENIRTWWAAASCEADGWFQVDLGEPCKIHAVQVNFADAAFRAPGDGDSEDYHAYRVLTSTDGKNWYTIIDRSENKTAAPHDYTQLVAPAAARFVKVVNLHCAKSLKFALSDLRVFGTATGVAPEAVTGFCVKRHTDDNRFVTFTWNPEKGADGYLIRYGVTPDALFQTIQVQGGKRDQLTIHALMRGVRYHYRIDVFNTHGMTSGEPTREAQ